MQSNEPGNDEDTDANASQVADHAGHQRQSLRNKIGEKSASFKKHFSHNKRSAWAIHPEESRFCRYWDIASALVLIFVCFMSPYEIAFHTGPPVVDGLFMLN